MKRLTEKETKELAIDICNKLNIKFIQWENNTYNGVNSRLVLEDIDGNIWNTTTVAYLKRIENIGFNKEKPRGFSNIPTKTTEKFIQEATKIHNGKYDYSKSIYTRAKEKICIICPDHGEFWQEANSHLKGHGCPGCSGNKRLTKKEFIEKSIAIHGDKYDYSRVNYINNNTKVEIICPIHGTFFQSPDKHMFGERCPGCSKNNSIGEESICRYLDEIKLIYTKQFFTNKIFGRSINRVFIDFSLEINNQIYWIEFNGEQHYYYDNKGFFGQSYQNFINQVNRDKAVREYALKNNIHFLEIPFLDIDRIPEILDAFLYDGLDITTKINPKILPTLWIKQN